MARASDKIPDDVTEEQWAVVEDHRHLIEFSSYYEAQRPGAPHADDLNWVGLMALVNAVQRWDPARGPLEPFALTWIQGAMRSATREARKAGRREAGGFLADLLSGASVIEQIPDPNTTMGSKVMNKQLRTLARQTLESYEGQDRDVVQLVIIDEMGLEAAGRQLGIPKTTVARIRDAAYERLMRQLARILEG